jgi:hypothetical protein
MPNREALHQAKQWLRSLVVGHVDPLMPSPVPAPSANPSRIANWGPMLLGVVCLGIGVLFAIGAYVDVDFMDVNDLDRWPPSVIMEIGAAVILTVFGPWCLLHGIRSRGRQKYEPIRATAA